MNESEPSHLIGLARDASGELRFARSTDGVNWALETGTVDPDFPVSDYALAKGVTVGGVEFFTLATGLNASGSFASKIWSTETGKNWVDLSNVSKISKPLGKRKGASLFYYDNYLVCFGGVDPNGNYHKDIYVSPDNGLGWLPAPANWAFGKMPGGIAGSTVYVEHVPDAVNDKDREFIWILGGSREDTSLSSSVWKCYLNKMLFARR
jgi:hypothetical protein